MALAGRGDAGWRVCEDDAAGASEIGCPPALLHCVLRQRTLARACAHCGALIITAHSTEITMTSIRILPALLLLATALSAAAALSDGPADTLGLSCPRFPR